MLKSGGNMQIQVFCETFLFSQLSESWCGEPMTNSFPGTWLVLYVYFINLGLNAALSFVGSSSKFFEPKVVLTVDVIIGFFTHTEIVARAPFA